MAYTALYRKFRPLKFSDMVGQEAITKTLRNQITSGRVGHAYLLNGTRGTGKTTTAKILARAVNCLTPLFGALRKIASYARAYAYISYIIPSLPEKSSLSGKN